MSNSDFLNKNDLLEMGKFRKQAFEGFESSSIMIIAIFSIRIGENRNPQLGIIMKVNPKFCTVEFLSCVSKSAYYA